MQLKTIVVDGRLNRWIRPELRAQKAYHVPDATGFIKLDAMENPFPLPPPFQQQWLQALQTVELNRYPSATAPVLAERLRRYFAIPTHADLLIGNGSDELIQMIMMAVADRDRSILAVEPSFAMYAILAQNTGLQYVGVPLATPDFSLDTQAVLAAITEHQPAVVFLANPNNPTGNLFEHTDIMQIIAAAPGLVILDEAYFSFAQVTCMDAMSQYDNLLILRTLSKLGLAGLRLGVLIGDQAWIQEINKVRLPYNVNSLSQASGEFFLKYPEMFQRQVDCILSERTRLQEWFTGQEAIHLWPSQTNFLTLRVPDAESLCSGLHAQKILIKNLHGTHELLHNCIRVTVGVPEENDQLLNAIARILE